MPHEIEAKVRIDDPDAFRRRMRERGHESRGTVFEVNRLFDDASLTLRRRGAALRVREEFPPGGGPRWRTLLTYKGPREPGRVKVREEVDLEVADADAVVAVLAALGYAETFRYEKRRTTWHVDPCEVVLDELPHIGWFAEVEGPDEAAVVATLESLGCGPLPEVTVDYIRLLIDRLKELGLDTTRAVF
jgi:adenylate cyclase class 2